MDSPSEDKVGTLIKVNQFILDNSTPLAVNSNIETERVILDADTENVFQNDSIATRPLEGFTTMKGLARRDVEKIVLLVRAGAMGYYTANPDPGKFRIVDFPDSKVTEDRDSELYVLADQVYDIGNPIKTLMAPFQVTSANVDDIIIKKNYYKTVLELPRSEKAISKAAAHERDRLMTKCFEVTLVKEDAYMLPFKYTNPMLYDKWLTARAIDDSGGGADTNGYEVHNYLLAAGASVSFGPVVSPAQKMYLRQIGGTLSVIVCTGATTADTCSTGFNLTPGHTDKKTFGELGLPAGNYIIFTNPNINSITVRAGFKI
jgi:hypothetical protein